jgi:hypothetical protein
MTLTALKPIIVKPARVSTPQCCVPVAPPTHAEMWRRDRYKKLRPKFDADRCQRESILKIDGKCYCRIHAGQLALDLWMKGDLVRKEKA